MTAQEKAKELIEEFSHKGIVNYEAAKKDAIILVNKCMEIDEWYLNTFPILKEHSSKRIDFWQEVKTEITKC